MTRTILTRTLAVAAVAAAAALAAPARLAAQMDTVIVTPTNPKADKLVAQAERMVGHGLWRAAAEVYLRSANIRTAEDPRASGAYTTAANLFFSAGDLDAARDAMIKAGNRALGRGDVVAAAHAYLGAGWVAARQRDERGMIEFTTRARLLASSPLMTAADREGILRRAGDGRTLADATTP